MKETKTPITIEMISGVEGPCLSLDDFRIGGPKPWGGGTVIKTWKTTAENVLTAMAVHQTEARCVYEFWCNSQYRATIERVESGR